MKMTKKQNMLAVVSAALSLAPCLSRAAQPVSRPYPGPKDLPFIGKGKCGEPKLLEDGFFKVTCWGPKEQLAPGETRNVMVELANPYNSKGLFSVVNMTAQLVDEDLRPVPLSDVYVHHYVSRSEFLLGSGAELRGSYSRAPLQWPLTLQVNGSRTAEEEARMTNVQLINTLGVAEGDLRECLECWCADSVPPEGGLPTRGSFFCCSNCPTTSDAPARSYLLEYTVTYRPMEEAANAAGSEPKVVGFVGFDVTGGKIEYNLLEPLGPNTTHKQVFDTVIDERCPQDHPITIVRCTAHQHVGSQCLSVYNLDKEGELICRSCPVYGKQKGVPGDEEGYVVAITDDNVSYEIAPGTKIRLESAYDGSERRLGLMGLMSMWLTDLDESRCTGQFGHGYGYSAHLAPHHAHGLTREQPALTVV